MKVPFVDLKAQYKSIKEEIDKAVHDVLDSCGFIMGENVSGIEKEFSAFCGAKHGIGVSSGSTALDLVMNVIGLKEGDEVITVPNTFIATTESITHAGGTIRFVDIDNDTYNIDVSQLRKAITEKTKAIIPVHLYGQMADMKQIYEIAEEKGIVVVEDACQAHAAECNGKRAPFGDIAVYSFFPGKNLGCYGDGGIIITNNDEIAEKTSMLRVHGSKKKYMHEFEGYGFRLDSLQAAVLRVKLKHLEEWTEKRRKAAALYNELLEGVDVVRPHEAEFAKHAYHLYVIRVKDRENMQNFLEQKGISTGIHYPYPLHLLPAYKYLNLAKGSFPVAEEYAEQILSLPIYPEISEDQIRYVVDSIKEFLSQ